MEIKECVFSHSFTKPLVNITPAPTHLWSRGSLPEKQNSQKVVSIVGARRCTSYGEEIAYRLAYNLAKIGVIVVSGLAYGIDSCAHRGCLDAGGATVAVLGTPINQIYPRGNYSLAERILERGAIISEYPVGHETHAWNFLERNRLISGLADIVVIVEASDRSGTLRTASYAIEQGKDLYVVPGNITQPMSKGCNMLLWEAHPYISFEDFTSRALGIKASETHHQSVSVDEELIINKLKAGLISGEEIAKDAKIDISKFNQTITLLELKNIVRPLGCNCWALV